jgi:hypothetical protein
MSIQLCFSSPVTVLQFNFIPSLSGRLMWAVSVFHAYGHQWGCQVLFHPRKCDGFGRSDGEGCERFWSSIRHLVSVLRVTGVCQDEFTSPLADNRQYFRRLFLLNRQIAFQHENGLRRLAEWLVRKYDLATLGLNDSLTAIAKLYIPEEDLREHWECQLEDQLRPSARMYADAIFYHAEFPQGNQHTLAIRQLQPFWVNCKTSRSGKRR